MEQQNAKTPKDIYNEGIDTIVRECSKELPYENYDWVKESHAIYDVYVKQLKDNEAEDAEKLEALHKLRTLITSGEVPIVLGVQVAQTYFTQMLIIARKENFSAWGKLMEFCFGYLPIIYVADKEGKRYYHQIVEGFYRAQGCNNTRLQYYGYYTPRFAKGTEISVDARGLEPIFSVFYEAMDIDYLEIPYRVAQEIAKNTPLERIPEECRCFIERLISKYQAFRHCADIDHLIHAIQNDFYIIPERNYVFPKELIKKKVVRNKISYWQLDLSERDYLYRKEAEVLYKQCLPKALVGRTTKQKAIPEADRFEWPGLAYALAYAYKWEDRQALLAKEIASIEKSQPVVNKSSAIILVSLAVLAFGTWLFTVFPLLGVIVAFSGVSLLVSGTKPQFPDSSVVVYFYK